MLVNSTYTTAPVSSTFNSCGEYGMGPGALAVNASVPMYGPAIVVANAPYSCLGAVVGFVSTSSDLVSDSVNYVVLTLAASAPIILTHMGLVLFRRTWIKTLAHELFSSTSVYILCRYT
jgi:hypothetical protein